MVAFTFAIPSPRRPALIGRRLFSPEEQCVRSAWFIHKAKSNIFGMEHRPHSDHQRDGTSRRQRGTMALSSITTAVVYHSGYGHTKLMAEAVADGAAASLIAINAEGDISENEWETLNAADAIIFGSPTYMGGPSWQFKKFADTSSKPWFEEKWKNKIFGGFTNSASINGDKLSTLQYFVLLASQHGGLWVSLAMKPANVKASRRDDPNRMGSYLAPMAQSDADAAPEEMSQGDLETARRYGVRVAEIAGRLATAPIA